MNSFRILAHISCILIAMAVCCPAFGQTLDTPDTVETVVVSPEPEDHDAECPGPQPSPEDDVTADTPKDDPKGGSREFYLGALAGLLGHEAGHLLANYALDTHPSTKPVKYGPIPFFTIEPGRPLTDREHYITASAGFNSQHMINEWLLARHPNLRNEDEPFLKGMATFNFWLTIGYAATAFAHTGPPERDTKGMADALGWSESRVGAMILVPTLLDVYRYRHPDSEWAKIASRVSKLFIFGLALTADN